MSIDVMKMALEALDVATTSRTGGAEMTDRELLELAAKAAGIVLYESETLGLCRKAMAGAIAVDAEPWNPLTNDGDALRLAVKLNMSVVVEPEEVWAGKYDNDWPESIETGNDPYAATRRAIVRAAAEIGRNMK